MKEQMERDLDDDAMAEAGLIQARNNSNTFVT